MNRNSIIDYWGCILIRSLGAVIRKLPLNVSLFLGKRVGELFYFVDFKHKAIAYANIKTAFRGQFSPRGLRRLTRDFYRSFGQNIIEILLIPLADKAYVDKHIVVRNKERIFEGFKRGKGVILLAVHAGSWELSNVVCANMGFAFNLFVRDQKYPRLEKLLNSYRSQRGCKLMERQSGMRQMLRALKNNEAIGMTADQGGKSGTTVKFFGKYASMSSGAVRLALKYNAAIVPAFYARSHGPYFDTFIEPPFELKKTGDSENDVKENLQELVHIFEKYISKYPQEYLWTYKIWKYAKEQDILILSDGKTGHLRQSQALAGIARDCLKDRGINANINIVEVKFKNKFSRFAQTFSSIFAGKYICQGCMWCLKTFLEEDVYESLVKIKPDIVISAGASVAPVNYVISGENLAKSITIMRPSVLSTKRFNLTVMSLHDDPPRKKSIVAIEGALNLINADYLKEQGELLKAQVKTSKEIVLGALIGGDSKDFSLSQDLMQVISSQIKKCLEKFDAEILITTSRRTSPAAEGLLKKEFIGYPRCGLLVIANEKNIPEAVGGILALSNIIIISPESISMISEAVNSGKYVFVFDAPGLSRKHRRFLEHFAGNKYIYLVKPDALADKIAEILLKRPEVHILRDNLLVTEAVKKIL
ncbi:MAG: ELM1/GtrOC1 family putative glycosyltransferase [Candidatus Omnitrophica bacterium]|nr:ELM1/GtrOC1 family putative glycosyltransferase [Candidatus Omnitrophota bacterium]